MIFGQSKNLMTYLVLDEISEIIYLSFFKVMEVLAPKKYLRGGVLIGTITLPVARILLLPPWMSEDLDFQGMNSDMLFTINWAH